MIKVGNVVTIECLNLLLFVLITLTLIFTKVNTRMSMTQTWENEIDDKWKQNRTKRRLKDITHKLEGAFKQMIKVGNVVTSESLNLPLFVFITFALIFTQVNIELSMTQTWPCRNDDGQKQNKTKRKLKDIIHGKKLECAF